MAGHHYIFTYRAYLYINLDLETPVNNFYEFRSVFYFIMVSGHGIPAINRLNKVVSRIKRTGVFTIDIAMDLIDEYGSIAVQAIEALKDGRGYKIRFGRSFQIKFFVGNRDYYVIFPETGYCGCISKYAVSAVERSLCYHIITYKVLDALGSVKELSFDKEDFRWVVDELKYKKLDMDI